MAWGTFGSFPRAILHIDGDSFFASCEIAKDPRLRGKMVITGKERGIVSSMSYEAKRAGVTRAMPLHDVRKRFPDAVILPSDYETYSLFSNRMYAIVRRYSPTVEEYSIDECFADLTGLRRLHHKAYAEIAAQIKRELETELGMTFSMGLAATKVLAKIGSRWNKPSGLVLIPLREREEFLRKTTVLQVWGIGPNTAAYLQQFGIRTALDFARRDEAWVRANVSKPIVEIWQELNGTSVYEVSPDGRESYQSISKTNTFTPPSRDRRFVFAQLSKNIENACIKARRWNLAAPACFFFLKTQEFKYHGCEIKLAHSTNNPQEILKEVEKYFPQVFRARTTYRASGITLLKLADESSIQLDLFGSVHVSQGIRHLFQSIDEIDAKFGKHTVFLASSYLALEHGAHAGERGEVPARATTLFKGETARQRLNIPSLGEV